MKTFKTSESDIKRLVSKILDKPPVNKVGELEDPEKIFGFDSDYFFDSNLDIVDPMVSDEYEFENIYKTYDEFKRDYPEEAKFLFGWYPKGGSFIFDRDKMFGEFNGLAVKTKR
jgi:oligoendopeptidase F